MIDTLCGSGGSLHQSKAWGKPQLGLEPRGLVTDMNLSRYIFPPTHRTKVAEIWNIPELHHWWLPNDEGYPPIIRSIRTFVEERTLKPTNQANEDVRNMKGIFSKMSIFDENPKKSPSNSPESCGGGHEAEVRHSRTGTDPSYVQLIQPQQVPDLNAMFDESASRHPTEWGIQGI